MTIPRRHPPAIAPLAAEYLDHYAKLAAFYSGDFHDVDAIRERAQLTRARSLPDIQLATILRDQNQRFGCGTRTLQHIDLLRGRSAAAVVTGQQTGLFGGPLYTVYKALTAIKLAEHLSCITEERYVPLFWLASDDHDLREVNHVKILNRGNELCRIAAGDDPPYLRKPVAASRLGRSIGQALQQLDRETSDTAFKAEVLQRLQASYQPDMSFSEAFARWLTSLLTSYGLILLDPSDARIKALGAAVFAQEVADRSPTSRHAMQASARLQQGGYHRQVDVTMGRLALFYVHQERHTIHMTDSGYTIKALARDFTRDDLLDLVSRQPHTFSPNVLLTPIFQDALLPTAVYVGGHAEIAYFAQLRGVYEAFGIPMPIIYPRKSCTLIDGDLVKVLDAHQLQVEDCWLHQAQLVRQVARRWLPATVDHSVGHTCATMVATFHALRETVLSWEPALAHTIETTERKLHREIGSLEKKITAAYAKRDALLTNQVRQASLSLYPDMQLQERVLNIVPWLITYGFGLIDWLYQAIDLSQDGHQIVRLPPGACS
jgi:bacillithiol biosynthesis cysteine-adding enzyme BshC